MHVKKAGKNTSVFLWRKTDFYLHDVLARIRISIQRKADNKMAYIKKISFDNTGRVECTCDRCGQGIQNVWTVTYKDGVIMHFGIDCFEKLSKKKLNAYGMKVMRKALKDIQYYEEELKKWTDGEYDETYGEYAGAQTWDTESYWHGREFGEYKNWMISEFLPYRIQKAQKEVDRFEKVNFER